MKNKLPITYTIIIIITAIIVVVSIFLNNLLNLSVTCCKYKGTQHLDSGLYIERYYTFCAGVFGEVITCYLTDSSSFRTKIGNYDEHGFLSIEKKSDYIMTYNIENRIETDTLKRIRLTKSELIQKSTKDKSTDTLKPVFGSSRKLCGNYHHYNDYAINDKFYISVNQYHCNDEWLNAVYFTDSRSFKILIGLEVPGEQISYYCTPINNYEFDFCETYTRTESDTIKTRKFILNTLKNSKFERVCK